GVLHTAQRGSLAGLQADARRLKAWTQMRPWASMASSARWYASPGAGSNTVTRPSPLHPPLPSERHHWKYTFRLGSSVESGRIDGASNDCTSARSSPDLTRSTVCRSDALGF